MARKIRQIGLPLGILVIGVAISVALANSRNEVPKAEIVNKPMLVETQILNHTNEQVHVSGFGTVRAKHEMSIVPQVSGLVVETSVNLEVGGVLKKDEKLFVINPREYQSLYVQQQAAVAKAQVELEEEMGLQRIAKREWELFEPTSTTDTLEERLALRKGQLENKQAALDSAVASLDVAALNLERTTLVAPCDAVVTAEDIEKGQLVSVGAAAVTLACSDMYEVPVNIAVKDLKWLSFPTANDQKGSEASLYQQVKNGSGDEKVQDGGTQAYVSRLLADLDPSGRMARVLIDIPAPMLGSPLLIGSFIEADIKGQLMKESISVPRSAIHEGDILWVKTQRNTLEQRKVNISFYQNDRATLSRGVSPGEEIVTSYIATPLQGMALRTAAEE